VLYQTIAGEVTFRVQHHLFAGCKHCIPKSNIYGDARFQHGPIKEKHRNKKTWPDIINVHKYEIPKQ